MKKVILENLPDLILLVFSSMLGYFFGRLHERTNSKYKAIEESLNSLYWRFEHTFLKKTKGAFIFSDLSPELKKEFYDILIDGYCYATSELKMKITEFRWQWISNDTEYLNSNFQNITQIIFETEKKLSKKLRRGSLKIK